MKNHYKLWTIISLIVVFSAGLFGGILLDKHIFKERPKRSVERPDYKRSGSTHYPTLDLWTQELGLTSEQQEKIRAIFKNNEERFRGLQKDMNESLRTIRIQLNEEIKSILTEDQKVKYEAMIEEYRSKRKRTLENRKKPAQEQNQGEKR